MNRLAWQAGQEMDFETGNYLCMKCMSGISVCEWKRKKCDSAVEVVGQADQDWMVLWWVIIVTSCGRVKTFQNCLLYSN